MKLKKHWDPQTWIPYTITACLAILFYFLLSNLSHIFNGFIHIVNFFSPVIYGLIIAYIINPLVELFEDKVFINIKNTNLRRSLSIIFAIIIVFLALSILIISLIPQIMNSVLILLSNFSGYARTLSNLLQENASSLPIDLSSLATLGSNALTNMANMIPKNMNSIISTSVNIGAGLFNLVISFIMAIYFLTSAKMLQKGFRKVFSKLLTKDNYESLSLFWKKCNRILVRYIVYDILDGIIIGLLNFIFFLILGLPYNILISVVVGLTNLAPTFGPMVGGVIGAFILVLVDPMYAIYFIIFTLVLQTVDGYIIKPKLFGNTLGVPAIWILISLIVCGRMFGVWGILLAIPIAAIIDLIIREFVFKNLDI